MWNSIPVLRLFTKSMFIWVEGLPFVDLRDISGKLHIFKVFFLTLKNTSIVHYLPLLFPTLFPMKLPIKRAKYCLKGPTFSKFPGRG